MIRQMFIFNLLLSRSLVLVTATSFDVSRLLQVVVLFLAIISLLTSLFILLFPDITSRSRENLSQLQERLRSNSRSYASDQSSSTALPNHKPLIDKAVMLPDQVGSDTTVASELSEALHQAHNMQTFAETYCRKLCVDDYITKLSILNTPWAVNLPQAYVPLRLHHYKRITVREVELPDIQFAQNSAEVLQIERAQIEHLSAMTFEPSEAIRHYQRCVILGDTGTGKTTLLKYIALLCAQKELRSLSSLPIYVDLNAFSRYLDDYNDVTNSSKELVHSLLEFAAKTQWKNYEIPLKDAVACMEQNLEEGNVLVLLDDLLDGPLKDATVNDINEHPELVFQTIRQLVVLYPKAYIVVTARASIYLYHAPLATFTELEILGFREGDIKRFVNNWFMYNSSIQEQSTFYRGTPSENVDNLVGELNHSRLQALTSHPILLTLLVLTAQTTQVLPMQRATLYAYYIASRFAQEKEEVHSTQIPSYIDTERLLQEIAWHFHIRGQQYFSLQELYPLVSEFLPQQSVSMEQMEAILASLSSERGLLKPPLLGRYSFLHLTLQEYFAAKAILERDERLHILLANAQKTWWREVLLFYVNIKEDATEILSYFWQEGGYNKQNRQVQLQDPLFHTGLILASQCLAASKSAALMYRSRIIQQLFDVLTDTSFLLTRQQIAETLSKMGENTVDNIYLRSGRPASETINRRLLDMLKDDSVSSQVKICIAHALGTFGNENTLLELTEILADERAEPEVRLSAIHTLYIASKQSIIEKMIGILPNRIVNRFIRLEIAKALRDISLNEAQISELLVLVSNQHVDLVIRCAIVDILATTCDSRHISILQQMYNQTDKQNEFSLYWHFIIVLVALGHDEYLSILFPILRNNAYSVDARLSIVAGLTSLRLYAHVPGYLSLLQEEAVDWKVRVGVVVALEAMRDRSLLPSLQKVLFDEDVDVLVRTAVADMIGEIGDQHIIQSIRQWYNTQVQNPYLHRCITTMLCSLGDVSTVPSLLGWFDTSEDITVAESLSMLRALIKLVGALDSSTQQNIIQLQHSSHMHMEVQRTLIALLPQLVYTTHDIAVKQTVRSSLRSLILLQRERIHNDIMDEAHQALWAVEHHLSPGSINSEYWYSIKGEE